jgi:eukaryotic-like serine/threonine-protein kinase
MMRQATRFHLLRGFTLAVCLLLLCWGGWEGYGRLHAQRLRDRLLDAPTSENVLDIVHEMGPYRRWLTAGLRETHAAAGDDTKDKLHASLALLPVDDTHKEYLIGRLLKGGPEEVLEIRAALRPHAEDLETGLWAELEERGADPIKPLRTACALAAYAPEDARWQKLSGHVANGLLAENALEIGRWAEALKPVGKSLLPPLADFLLREGRAPADRGIIARLYRDYAEDTPDGFALLEKALSSKDALPDPLALPRRQANAAAALAVMGRWDRVRPLLRHAEDPTARSYLIAWLRPGGVAPQALIDQLTADTEPAVKQGLLLAFGELASDRLPNAQRDVLRRLYETDPDPGIHSAADWTLRQWGQQKMLAEIDLASRERKRPEGRGWFVNGQGQTMVIVPRSKDWFWMEDEEKKKRYRRWITRDFALSAREVTVAEFLRFREKHDYDKDSAKTDDCLLQLAEQEGRDPGKSVLLPGRCARYSACAGFSEAEWLPLADGSGVGIRLPGGNCDGLVAWRGRGTAAIIRMV